MKISVFVGERAGFEVLRTCERIVEQRQALIRCVASDANHRSSAEIIRACVKNALAVARSLTDRALQRRDERRKVSTNDRIDDLNVEKIVPVNDSISRVDDVAPWNVGN